RSCARLRGYLECAQRRVHIRHRISINATGHDREVLARLGVLVGTGLVTFEIDESDSAWPRISEWATRRSALDMVSSHFSPEEIAEAEWLGMDPRWHWSYPQPEDDFGFRSVTYDLSQYCSTCGIGAVQKAAFRMKSEPRWGRNGILQ